MADSNDDIPPVPLPPADVKAGAVPPVETPPAVPGASTAVPPTAPAAPAAPPAAPAAPPAAPAAPAYGGQQAAPAYGAAPAQPAGPAQGLSVTSMILGIVGVVGALLWLGFLPALAAVITGHLAQRRQPWARGFWITGLITGYIGLGIAILTFLGFLAVWIFAFTASSAY